MFSVPQTHSDAQTDTHTRASEPLHTTVYTVYPLLSCSIPGCKCSASSLGFSWQSFAAAETRCLRFLLNDPRAPTCWPLSNRTTWRHTMDPDLFIMWDNPPPTTPPCCTTTLGFSATAALASSEYVASLYKMIKHLIITWTDGMPQTQQKGLFNVYIS